MPTTRVPISELQIGMYVTGLDLPWFRSPFLRHSFKVERPAQIEKLLRSGVKMVDIDLDRGIAPRPRQRPEGPQPTTLYTPSAHDTKPIKTLAQLNEEYAQATVAKQQLTQSVQSVFTKIANTGTVHPQQAADAVHEITIVTRTLTPSSVFMALSQNRASDPMLSQHALTTCTLALILGQTFQFNPLELQELATAALLHDIGLLQIDPTLVRRAHADPCLSPIQQREFETHPRLGVRTLQQAGGIETAILHLIANHHAYLDDSGYPKDARGEFTSDRTRILMIVDRYDELLSGFGGATPLPSHRTFQQLYQEARQNKLDQQLLSTFIGLVGIYPVHSRVRLNTKERAVVTKLNQETLHQPIITITHQTEDTTYPNPFTVNLADQPNGPQIRAIEAVITS
jgi:HD-GYP domain-containing protein (c-di-GMP phosphodiesterase class II)